MDDFREISGYREVEHMADWALQVWAPDFDALLVQAALGMAALLGGHIDAVDADREISLQSEDPESLLVGFLSEVLYLNVHDGLAFINIEVNRNGSRLSARLHGGKLQEQMKEIKAVTYHNLTIRDTPTGLETTIVFDV